MINDWEMKLCRLCRKKISQNKNGLCDDCDAKVIAFRIAKFILNILFLGGITMFVVGILGVVGIISGIALGGSITMIVLGTILGLIPLLRKLF